MNKLEIRVAALQFLVLKLCAEVDAARLEQIGRTLKPPAADDAESAAIHAILVEVLAEASERARCKARHEVRG